MVVAVTYTGPVGITGASGQVGRALQARLADVPNVVVPLGRADDLARSLRDVQVLVHLAGGLRPRRPDTYRSSNLETVEAAVHALADSTVTRVVFLSFVTAEANSPNPYLRYKGQAERVLLDSGVPTVVFRTGHVIGPPSAPGPTAASLLASRGRVSVLGDGTQRVSPVLLEDVVEAVARATLDTTAPTGVHPLTGPDVMSMDGLVRLINGDSVRIRHITPRVARGLSAVLPSLPRPLVDVMLGDAVASDDPSATARRFAIRLHHVSDVWATRTSSPTRLEPAR